MCRRLVCSRSRAIVAFSAVVVVEDGLVEGEGELRGWASGGEARGVDFGAQGAGAVFEAGRAGIADEGGDGGVDRGGAQVEAGQELFGEFEFVVGLAGVDEGEGEGAQGLVVGGFAGFGVLFGFGAPAR